MNTPSDSELIALYHEGKLDGESMNRLERRALDDPFLADALEGFSQVKKPHIQVRKDLRERLEKRLHKGKRRSIVGQTSSWAAAAAIVLTVGAAWFFFHEERLKNEVTAVKAPALPDAAPHAQTLPDSILADAEQLGAAVAVKKTQVKKAPPLAAAPVMARKQEPAASRKQQPSSLPDSIRLGEVAVVGYATRQKSDITGSVATIRVDSQRARPMEQALQGRASGVRVGKFEGKPAQILHGQVIAANDKTPLPGVSVQILGTGKSTVTDADGHFSIAAQKDDRLGVTYIGYESKEVKPLKSDSLMIAMNPDHGSLNEVVITGYGKPANRNAEPVGGWPGYREYLEEKAISPDGRKGSVVLEFSVGADQIINDVVVVRAYNEKAAALAEDILKNGPAWRPGTGNRGNERVRITIRFR
ncbi:MAG: carboxypeptidase-like regulatory domain-containing protein [Mucilaginibacter polytrichastri]|nr:carboxypeptidase-like regulatory domain-containing protein [Mucilaginibacter polytrichastri]